MSLFLKELQERHSLSKERQERKSERVKIEGAKPQIPNPGLA